MGKSFVQRSADAFTDTSLGKIVLDPLVVNGTVLRLDFLNAFSNPNADGALAGGAVFKNMVEGGVDATYTLLNQGMSVVAGKKGLSSPGTDVSQTSFLALPVGALDMHTETGDHNFIHHLWYKPTAGYISNGSQMLGDRAVTGDTSAYWGVAPSQMSIVTGTVGAGDSPSCFVRANAAANQPAAIPNDQQLNLTTLLSAAYVGGNIFFYLNGALFSSIAYANTALGLPSRRSHGTFVFAGVPAANDTVTVNGNLITFVAAGAAGAQVNVGADATASAQALKTYINANKATLNATCEGTGSTVVVLQRDTTLLALAKSSANVTVGAVVPAKSLKLTNYLKGEYYGVSVEDLTVSGRTAVASALAEYNGYRPKLTAAGL